MRRKQITNVTIPDAMEILLKTYNQILVSFPSALPEAGGILGCRTDGVVCVFRYDPGSGCSLSTVYEPNVALLNKAIEDWAAEGIAFCGIIHSHLPGVELLSQEDLEYMDIILNAMPQGITQLYFPIMIPKEKILPFVARMGTDGIIVQKDTLNIIT